MARQVHCVRTISKMDISFHTKSKLKKQVEEHCMLTVFTIDIRFYRTDVSFFGIQPYWNCLWPLVFHGYTKNIELYDHLTGLYIFLIRKEPKRPLYFIRNSR